MVDAAVNIPFYFKVQARKIKLPLKFADSWSIFADEVMPITKIVAIALEREFHRASHNKC